ncbi:hypothetical protein ACTNE0_02300 [Bacillota bacterium HCP3S3_E9]
MREFSLSASFSSSSFSQASFRGACRELLPAMQTSGVYVPENGFLVFLSFSDGSARADVVHGSGADIAEAFADAQQKAWTLIQKKRQRFRWLKADVVTEYAPTDAKTLAYMIKEPGWNEFFRFGLTFDRSFRTALLEEELNGAKILDYASGSISLADLNRYLKKAGRPALPKLPEFFLLFQTAGFFYDSDSAANAAAATDADSAASTDADSASASGCVIPLIPDGLSRGRREVRNFDAAAARSFVTAAASFLEKQVQQDGSFRYGYYPRFDRVIPGYNCMRHASTIWSLLCQYRITQKASVLSLAARSIDYLLSHALVYRDPDTAYLSEPLKDEIKLGGGGVLILAITEYLDLCSGEPRPEVLCSREPRSAILRSEEPRPAILRSGEPLTKAPNAEILHAKDVLPEQEALRHRYTEIACTLGNGILSLLNPETGEFSHVLNMDFSLKERYRTVYYDGEAAYALCRLYRLTKEEKWLFYAEKAVDHFLAADYTRYRDHWVAYAMNEITRYIHRDDYDTFALRNARVNLDFLYKRETTYHTFLELLMVTFETYERILAQNPGLPYLKEFDLPYFLRTIRVRADRMLNGFFFPEYAMYMRCPDKILGSFMVRHDGFRVRIDDVQHNIGGFYLYYKNYSRLLALGMPEDIPCEEN